MVHYKKKQEKVIQFFFYNNDIEQCVKSTRWRWIQSRPDIPSIWPMKIETNLSRKEILHLENADFQLPQHTIISPWRLFGMEELLFDLSSYSTLTSPDDYPKIRSGKIIWRTTTTPHNKACQQLCVFSHLEGSSL
jgi:hypothetical protein